MFTVTCSCGANFETTLPNKKYCSATCYPSSARKGPFRATCLICAANFVSRQPGAKYCSDKCRKVVTYKVIEKLNLACHVCGNSFQSSWSAVKYCSEQCRQVARKEYESVKRRNKVEVEKVNSESKSLPNTKYGCYVYVWLDGDKIFYVGRAFSDERVIRKHTNKGLVSKAQFKRESIGSNFNYRIVREGLTELGAKLVESVLINVLKPECNIQPGDSNKYYTDELVI